MIITIKVIQELAQDFKLILKMNSNLNSFTNSKEFNDRIFLTNGKNLILQKQYLTTKKNISRRI